MTALFPTYHTSISASNGANLLCATVLGGGITHKVTHYILDEYKAFQRCLRASLEGFVVSVDKLSKQYHYEENIISTWSVGCYADVANNNVGTRLLAS